MKITTIGKYTVIQSNLFKQIYSPNNKMLQIGKDRIFYVDTNKMATIKSARKVIKWIYT